MNDERIRAFEYALGFYNPDTDSLNDVFENADKIYNYLNKHGN